MLLIRNYICIYISLSLYIYIYIYALYNKTRVGSNKQRHSATVQNVVDEKGKRQNT